MMITRRAAGAALLSVVASGVAASTAQAQAYPSKPLRIVVPTGAGGITDIVARIVGARLSERLGQPVMIDNRAGASGIIGTEVAARAAPDGYTLLMVYPSHPVNPTLKKQLPYDTLRDLTGVTTLTTVSLVLLVPPALPVRNIKELIELAKKDRVTFASVGAGSLAHLGAELFRARTGIEMTHVPYRSAPAAQQALMSGEVMVFFDTPITAVPLVKDGRLRALGVSTRTRSPLLPDVPTIEEAGVPGYEVLGWNGILVPSGTPDPIVQKLNAELRAILAEPEIRAKLEQQGAEPAPMEQAAFAKLIRDDVSKWGDLIRAAGIQPE
ncbi:Bug family tripartite tricarboxylate transporter substrate binding protein [Reyranella sp.]|uniref:Bug family tripartite tricarboxylate transporter substrate binding protein n=1 Tax=Reyranella sp. TaxID=1929291 RepID=UPI003D0C2FFC